MYWKNPYAFGSQGTGYYLRLRGSHEDHGQFEIVPYAEDPIQGDGLTFEKETPIPFSNNLFYEPIPFEFLQTYETKP